MPGTCCPALLKLLAAALLLPGAAAGPAVAEASTGGSEIRITDHLRSQLVAATSAARPGETLRLGLRLEHDPGWHTYWKNPGDSGLPTRLRFSLPEGVDAGPIEWPLPERQPAGELTNFGYSDTELLPVSLQIPSDFAEPTLEIELSASWLICELECIPGSADYRLSLPVLSRAEPAPTQRWKAEFTRAAARRPLRLEDAGATYSADDPVRISLPLTGELGAALAGGTQGWTLIPATAQIVANADPPRLQRDGATLLIEVARSEFFAGAPERIELLLASEKRGFEFEATLASAAVATAADAGLAAAPPAPVGVLLALLLAFAGGLVLNLMPCVFPVLSLKALGAIKAAERPAELRQHGLWYALGVVSSVLLLAALLLALRAGGQALGWGFHLQQPGFIAGMALLLFAMGLSFSGVYEFGAGFAGVGQRLTEGGGRRPAFFTGVLACVVASPCTAPFMGTALGAAVLMPAWQALLVFVALGLGLAFPMLLLGYLPGLARRLPRPGAWMQTFRELLAFPVYLTVLWLVWVFGQQTSLLALAALGVGLITVAFALWLLRQAELHPRSARALQISAVVLLTASLTLPLVAARAVEPADPEARAGALSLHQPWSAQRLAELRAAGTPVLVNITADWCITCLANERVALSSEAFATSLGEFGVVYLKGDWTRQDADITVFLELFGRNGVPLYVLYPPHGDAIVLPQLLTPARVRAAFEQLPPRSRGG
jgi:thiol:disulfide interchange protein DsbD